jgi:methylenetetrahydrofolate--tRNA-(uracil-5-)-methyltransferase
MNNTRVTVIGAGLAGCEAAWSLAEDGFSVKLLEMKPKRFSPAHHDESFAELVCSNSLKAERVGSAGGLLKAEMRLLGSLTLKCAEQCRVPAGGALAVDREAFSRLVTEKISAHPGIEIVREEVAVIPEGNVIIATGPLTSDKLAAEISALLGRDSLSFYDAAAPVVEYDSLDLSRVFFAARYGRGDADYINCPMNKPEYEAVHTALVNAEPAPLKDFEITVYEGCMPVEVLAKRGLDALRFGPLKPVGLTDPKTGRRPWAAVQLRRENASGTLYNLVGFQTNLKFGEQKRVFSLIPGLEGAVFSRYGVMHRNTFIDSPRVLNQDFSLKANPRICFAGQITGVEGYMESAASGIIAAKQLARRLLGKPPLVLPQETMSGALCRYISDKGVADFQPMGANMGLLPPLAELIKDKRLKYEKLAERALESLKQEVIT